MRRIGIMLGSDSDLKQCGPGLKLLKGAERDGKAEVVIVITNSIHRNTKNVLVNLEIFTPKVDVWIIGAGMANHLTGTADAYLRYFLQDDRVPVIGVAFQGKTDEETQAAILSIQQVPGTQVIFNGAYVGENGFLSACRKAIEDDLPPIKVPNPKPMGLRNLDQAIEAAESLMKEVK